MENLNISGVYSNSGGVFGDISVTGSGKLNGDVECQSFRSSGASTVLGDLKCQSFGSSGSTKITGSVYCDGELKTSGVLAVEGDADAKEVRISGSGRFAGNIKAENLVSVSGAVYCEKSIVSGKDVRVSGSAKVNGDLAAEEIHISGSFNVRGTINGEVTEIVLGEGSGEKKAGSVGGRRVTVKRKREDEDGFLYNIITSIEKTLFPSKCERNAAFVTDFIEADVICLEYTDAKLVRGNDITIGDGCNVGRVEYYGKVTFSDSATIGEMVEI